MFGGTERKSQAEWANSQVTKIFLPLDYYLLFDGFFVEKLPGKSNVCTKAALCGCQLTV